MAPSESKAVPTQFDSSTSVAGLETRDALSPLRRALLTIERLEAELEARESGRREPLAIRSAALRFPGGVRNLSGLEQLLWNAVDATTTVPSERWNSDILHEPQAAARGKIVTRRGAFLDDVAGFDASFFAISPREALQMDPQQRLLLELAWEALENAGIAPDSLRGSRTGVFVGIGIADWAARLSRAGTAHDLDAYTGTGTGFAFAAGRIAFHLGLQGPALALDTTCSSSLVALHLACQSLRAGECDLALVGGVHLMLAPETMIVLSQSGALSSDGRCKTFDARADGYGRGEGAAVLVLSRKADVSANAPPLLGIVRGSAVNHDGPSSALTVPNGPAQAAVIRRALDDAQVSPSDVGYIEAHGTGTQLGDPMEVSALAQVFANGRKAPLRLGSLKTNLGHLEAAAGLAGLLKLCLVLSRRQIPPHLHLTRRSPHIAWDSLPFEVPTKVTDWSSGQPLLGGVSAFGLSGTNAHAIIEAPARALGGARQSASVDRNASNPEAAHQDSASGRAELLVLSARTRTALKGLALEVASHVERHGDLPIEHLAYSLSACRALLPERMAVVASSHTELSALLRTRESEPASAPETRSPIAFLFTGQGSPYPGMGRDLYAEEPVFREAIDACDKLATGQIAVLPGAAIRGEITESLLTDTAIAQPALFALQYALSALWQSFGIVPDIVLGHSVGEIAAAQLSGAISLEAGLKFAIARGRAMAALPPGGAMVSVRSDAARLEPLLKRQHAVSIAALNAPGQTVIAGERASVNAIVRALELEGVPCMPLTVSHAFHSPLMDPALDAIAESAPVAQPPALCFISTLTGERIAGALDAAYFRKQARGTVRFSDAIRRAWADGARAFVEIGPRPTLLGLTKASLPEARVLLASLKPGTLARSVMRTSLAQLIELGANARLSEAYAASARRYVQVPNYPFEHQRFWVDFPETTPATARATTTDQSASATKHAAHPLLGPGVKLASNEIQFRCRLSDEGVLAEHRIANIAVVPLSALLDAALTAASVALSRSSVELESFEMKQPLLLAEGEAQELEILVSPRGPERASLIVSARAADALGTFSEIATASAVSSTAAQQATVRDLNEKRARLTQPFPLAALSSGLSQNGLHHGQPYRGFTEAFRGDGEFLARVNVSDPPWIALDLAIQAVAMAALQHDDVELLVPSSVGECNKPPTTPSWVHARLMTNDERAVIGNAELLDAHGNVLATVRDVCLVRTSTKDVVSARDTKLLDWAHELVFRELELPVNPLPAGRWLMLAEGGAISAALRRALVESGSRVAQAFTGPSFREIEAGLYELNPDDETGYSDVLARSREVLGGPLDGVIHLWSQRGADAESATVAVSSALSVARALEKSDDLTRLILVTRGAQPVLGASPNLKVFQAPLWGLGRALLVEQPELGVALIDLDDSGLSDHGQDFLTALASQESQTAFRAGKLYGARLVAAANASLERLKNGASLTLSPNGTYLVTGGLGGLGLQVVAWLVTHGAGHVEILSRSEPHAEARKLLERANEQGVKVHTHICDITDRTALEQTLRAIADQGRSVCGVVHAAAVIDDALVAEQHPKRVSGVLAPKIAGTSNLHEALGGKKLEFFFCFSSLVSLLGSRGQTNYAAANAFLDAFASMRRARGEAATTVQWGPWAGAGTAQTLADQSRWTDLGLSKIPPSLGLRAMELAISFGTTNLAILPITWQRFLSQLPRTATPAIYAELCELHLKKAAPTRTRDEALLARLDNVSTVSERKALLLDHLLREAALILRVSSVAALSPTRPLNELGFDSLLAVELRNAVEQTLGVTLKVSKLFEHPTLLGLAEYLAHARQGEKAPTTTPPAAQVSQLSSQQRTPELSLIYFASGTSGPDHDKYRYVLEQARLADDAGFRAIWIPERHFFEFGALYPDPSVLAAALATVTRRIRLRAGSVVLPLHHPLHLAERWAMVDNLSGGRVDLSVATGWSPLDFVFAPERYAERLSVMRDHLAKLVRLWRGESARLKNGLGEAVEVQAFPRPVQPELPIWYTCSGGRERFIEAGSAGKNVLTALLFQTYDQLADKIAAYRKARADNGHDPATGVVTLMLHTYLDADAEAVIPAIRAPFLSYLESTAKVWLGAATAGTVQSVEKMTEAERRDVLDMAFNRYVHTAGLFGTPEACRARLAELLRLGVDEVACLVDFGVEPARVQMSLRHLAALLPTAARSMTSLSSNSSEAGAHATALEELVL